MTTLLPADLASTLTLLGLDLGRVTSKEVWACCPVHYERTGKHDLKPKNFSVNVNTGWAFCFSCHYKADLYRLVSDVRGCDPYQAITWLRENGASVVDLIQRVRETMTDDRAALPRVLDRHGRALAFADPDMEFVLLPNPPEAQVEKRDLCWDSVERYRVRWSDGAWVLPFTDAKGTVHGWQTKSGPDVKNHPYDPKHPERSIKKSEFLFGRHCFSGDRAILVESPLDAVRLHTAGYDGAVASYGSYVSDTQVRLLLDMTSEVVLCMDNDEAGWHSAIDVFARLSGRTKVRVVSYADLDAKDPGDLTDRDIDHLLSNFVSVIDMAVMAKRQAQAKRKR